MPRVSDSGGARFHVPGCYEQLLVGRCRCGNPCRSDPRLGLREMTAEQSALFDWFKAQCSWEAELDKAEQRATGEPFTVLRRRFGGHNVPREDRWPAWLRDPYSDVEKVRVYADDTIAPCSEHPLPGVRGPGRRSGPPR
jgi:hypothetical protein